MLTILLRNLGLVVMTKIGTHNVTKIIVWDSPFGNYPVFDRFIATLDANLGGPTGGVVGLPVWVVAVVRQTTMSLQIPSQQEEQDHGKDQEKASNHQVAHDGDFLLLKFLGMTAFIDICVSVVDGFRQRNARGSMRIRIKNPASQHRRNLFELQKRKKRPKIEE